MEEHKILNLLKDHVPANTVAYCLELWQRDQFLLKLRRSRITKVGDFICHPHRTPRITVNSDLHPYSFLITYIHEVAHLEVHRNCRHSVDAHGEEWKQAFQRLMTPVMTEDVFPAPLLEVLGDHMSNPKASTFSDSRLTAELRKLDEKQAGVILLSQLAEGSVFALHGRWFKKGKVRRTRVVCREVNSKRNYLVPIDAPVENAQLSFL